MKTKRIYLISVAGYFDYSNVDSYKEAPDEYDDLDIPTIKKSLYNV